MLPDPKDLTKELWRSNVLPIMGIRMGLQDDTYERLLSDEEREIETKANLIPESPLISKRDLDSITAYIVGLAPDSIPYDISRISRSKPLVQFNRRDIILKTGKPAVITALKFDTNFRTLYIGTLNNTVYGWKWDDAGVSKAKVSSPVVHITFYKGTPFFTEIGDLLPSEESRGSFGYAAQGRTINVLDSLHRPVFAEVEDLNGDGNPEILISNFGKNLGSLSLFEGGHSSRPLNEQVLLQSPGATKTYVADMNNDGRKDIVALLSQGDESIYIFYNQGDLKFKAKRVLRYPPHYGTSDFLLIDYNKDGRRDIVTAHGDNADYSIMLKPYHGMRISINDGDDVFQEKLFFPVYGLTRLIAEDFDADGDIDFAGNAFYPDYSSSIHEAFVYLENRDSKSYRFQSFAHRSDMPIRSLTMEKADIDSDGDSDIILGHFAFSPVPAPQALERKWQSAKHDLIVFLNNTKR
jgi:hypothetical protein